MMEMYSEPRITKEAEKWGLRTGGALDLKTGWDLNEGKDREAAEELIRSPEEMAEASQQIQQYINQKAQTEGRDISQQEAIKTARSITG